MNTVTVNRAELLSKLKTNRDKHAAECARAEKSYRLAMIAELSRRLEEAKNDLPIARGSKLPVPENHTADYDRAIEMLEMSVNDHITLQSHEFDQLVRDNWAWKAGDMLTKSFYLNANR